MEWIHCEPDVPSHCRKNWLAVTKSGGSGSYPYLNICSEDYTAYQGVTNTSRQSCPAWGQTFLWTPMICSKSYLSLSKLPTSISSFFLNSHFIKLVSVLFSPEDKRDLVKHSCPRENTTEHLSLPNPNLLSQVSPFCSCNPDNSDPWSWQDQFSSSSWHLSLWPKLFCPKQHGHRFWTPLVSPTCLLPPLTRHCKEFPPDPVSICNQTGWICRGAATHSTLSPTTSITWVTTQNRDLGKRINFLSIILRCRMYLTEGWEVHKAEITIKVHKNIWPWEKASQTGLSEPEIGFRSEKLLLLKIYPVLTENKVLIINKQVCATDTPDFIITSFSSDHGITHSTELDCSCQPEESSKFKIQITLQIVSILSSNPNSGSFQVSWKDE